jgi:hypothetical protein
MSIGLDHFDMSRWSRIGLQFRVRSARASARWGGPLWVVLPIVLIVGAAGLWLLLPASDGADADPAALETATATQSSAAPDEADISVQSIPQSRPDAPTTSTGQQPAAMTEPPPVARLRILGQSWKRGGLGSDAQATFTLRNDNAYAVKDIELGCAFARRDGTHLTNRKRIIPVTVEAKARKRFTRLHVGFVNVHASRINCSVLTANRV